MNKTIREFSKEMGKTVKRRTMFLENVCNECGENFTIAKVEHNRAKHPYLCSKCVRALRRHKGIDGKPLPQTEQKKSIQSTWDKMIERTMDEKCPHYHRYGGRGIAIEFKSFGHFYEWSISNGHEIGLTIERRNGDLNYNEDNCRWATRLEQAQNRTTRPNKHKFAGIKKRGERFMSSVMYDSKEHYCGTFNTPEEAHQAYLNKKAELTKEIL